MLKAFFTAKMFINLYRNRHGGSTGEKTNERGA